MRAGLLLACLLGCSRDYVRVVVTSTGADEFVSGAVDLEAAVIGSGRRVPVRFRTPFSPLPGARAGERFTDFLLVLEDGAGPEVDLRVSAITTSTVNPWNAWSADLRLALPQPRGREVVLALASGEATIGPSRVVTGLGHGVAGFQNGVVVAWPEPGGVAIRVERTPERSAARTQRIVDDGTATDVQVASRPGPAGAQPDLFALAWRGTDGTFRVVLRHDESPSAPVPLAAATRGAVACARLGSSFDAVTVTEADGLEIRLWSADGTETARVPPPADPPSGLLGVLVGPDSSVVIASATPEPLLTRLGRDGTVLGRSVLPGAPAALASSPDGTRILVVLRMPSGELAAAAAFAADVTLTGEAVLLAPASRLPAAPLDGVAIGDCAVAWSELRADGSGLADLRYRGLDADGRLTGDTHVVNVDLEGDAFAPAVACTAEGAFAAFHDRADPQTTGASFRMRRLTLAGP